VCHVAAVGAINSHIARCAWPGRARRQKRRRTLPLASNAAA
jgi:hypothetical protein